MSKAETAGRTGAISYPQAAVGSVWAQLAEAQAALAEERNLRAAERAACTAQYQQVLGLLSGYEATLSEAQGGLPVAAQPLGPVSTLIQSLHATIDIQREALGDDMSGVYYAGVVAAAQAYWDLQTTYGRDFQVAPGLSQRKVAPVSPAPVPDKGPWSLVHAECGRTEVVSEDVTHAVRLQVDGEFANAADRLAYACWLRDALMGSDPTVSSRLDTCLNSLRNCYQEFTEIREAAGPALKLLQGYVDLLDEHLAKGVPADSPFYEDRRILAEAVATLGGVIPRANAAPQSQP